MKDTPQNADFSIEIIDRGESIVYREAGREYYFDIFLGGRSPVLFADSYWDGTLPPTEMKLAEAERSQIIPQLVAYLGAKGESVRVLYERQPRKVADILNDPPRGRDARPEPPLQTEFPF